jgi:hypothetical protein
MADILKDNHALKDSLDEDPGDDPLRDIVLNLLGSRLRAVERPRLRC